MGALDTIRGNIDEHARVIAQVRELLSDQVERAGRAISHALANSGTVFWCGNGGSAADSQHLAAELIGRFKADRRPLRSVALTTDSSVLTCIANDYNYDDIFARQIEGLGRRGDVLVASSTSGNSKNVLKALQLASESGITTIACLGRDGGLCKDFADHALIVPSEDTARIQEAHILIGHILCDLVEMELRLA